MDPQDTIEIGGKRLYAQPTGAPQPTTPAGRRFLSVWYRCCHTYGRLNRNAAGTEYVGRCPRCGAAVRALIGPGGTSRRCFEAR